MSRSLTSEPLLCWELSYFMNKMYFFFIINHEDCDKMFSDLWIHLYEKSFKVTKIKSTLNINLTKNYIEKTNILTPECSAPFGSKEIYLPDKNLAKWHQDSDASSQVSKVKEQVDFGIKTELGLCRSLRICSKVPGFFSEMQIPGPHSRTQGCSVDPHRLWASSLCGLRLQCAEQINMYPH